MQALSFVIEPGGCFSGAMTVPGDKSISHRALILGAIAEGKTRISGFLSAADPLATLNALHCLDVPVRVESETDIIVEGVGLHGLRPAQGVLDFGNSATALRLMAGLLSAQSFTSKLTGDTSLQQRPMDRIITPLCAMGAQIESMPGGYAPLTIGASASGLKAIDYYLPVASAQLKSALLLAGLYADGESCVISTEPVRDHTERMLELFSCAPITEVLPNQNIKVSMPAMRKLIATDVQVPGDLSSAAFFLVGASISKGSNLCLRNVGINPSRDAVITILRKMGADIVLSDQKIVSNEPVADIQVKSAELSGITIPAKLVPIAMDEFPAIMIAAACAKGKTYLTGASELRVKESDRIMAMARGLEANSIQTETRQDGICIEGGRLQGGRVDSMDDHRIAMAFAIAGVVAQTPIIINRCNNVTTSYPDFVKHAVGAGLKIQMSE